MVERTSLIRNIKAKVKRTWLAFFTKQYLKTPSQVKLEKSISNLKPETELPNVINALSGFVFGPVRNLSPWHFDVDAKGQSITFKITQDKPVSLNFNHVVIWIRNSAGKLRKYKGKYVVSASSHAKSFEDLGRPLTGGVGNSVSFHSKREVKPWWQVELDGEHHIECIEFFNRKDNFGSRAASIACAVTNKAGKVVFEQSRYQLNSQKKVLEDELKASLENINQYYIARGMSQTVDNFYRVLREFIASHKKSEKVNLAQRNHVNSHIMHLFEHFAWNTPDLALSQEKAETLKIEDRKFVKVVCFKRRLARPMMLSAQLDQGDVLTLNESGKAGFEAELLRLKKECWLLPQPHVFDIEINESKATELKLWAPDIYSGMGSVLRLVYTSQDGENWQVLDSTIEDFKTAVALITLREWLYGKKQSPEFTKIMGRFFGVYRLHRARAYKKFFLGNKDNLKVYMDSIEEGGGYSTHLPKVIFTRHGLNVPFSEMDSGFLTQRMHEFCNLIKNELGASPFPCYGTLLGLYRDKDFLPHDDDIDVAIIVDGINGKTPREVAEIWRQKVEALGIKTKFPTPYSLNFHCYYEDCDMDLFIKVKKPNKNVVATHMERYQIRDVEMDLLEPLSTYNFNGFEFSVPNQIEGFLESRYGRGWTKPDPAFEL